MEEAFDCTLPQRFYQLCQLIMKPKETPCEVVGFVVVKELSFLMLAKHC